MSSNGFEDQLRRKQPLVVFDFTAPNVNKIWNPNAFTTDRQPAKLPKDSSGEEEIHG